MMGWAAMAGPAAEAGLEFTTYPSVPPWPAGLRHEDGWARIEVALFGAATEQDIITEARAYAADVLVVDCMLTAGYAAARGCTGPSCHWCTRSTSRSCTSGATASSASTSMPYCNSRTGCWPCNHPGSTIPDRYRTTPPTSAPSGDPGRPRSWTVGSPGASREPGNPWVLLSLSTTLHGQADVLPWFLDALGTMPVRVLLTLGGVLTPESVDAPANVTVCGHVPHEAVLPHIAAVVTHAGMSTVATTLAAGIPMVCVPQGRDQPLNAQRVADVGAGLHVAPDAPASELATALDTVLSNPRYRTAARDFAAATAALGNGRHAADLVEHLPRPTTNTTV